MTNEDYQRLALEFKNLKKYYPCDSDDYVVDIGPTREYFGTIDENQKRIIINGITYSVAIKSLRHEYRHLWQKYHYPNFYNFWVSDPDYQLRGYIYKNCSIEKDANRFAGPLENDETDIMEKFNSPEEEKEYLMQCLAANQENS